MGKKVLSMKNRMNRTLAAVLAILLAVCISGAAAERTLTTEFEEGSAGALLSQLISEKTGLPIVAAEGEEPGAAANRMLQDPECVLCGSQNTLIAGLQGYTTADLRDAMVPVCRVAVSPLYLVMDRSTAEGYGISDLETLQQYIPEHEYELVFARHLGADPVDLAVTQLSNETEVMTDWFSADKIPEALLDGDADAAVFTGRELAELDGDWLILCCLGAERSLEYPDIPCAAEAGWTPAEGEWVALFISAEASEEQIGETAQAALTVEQADLPAGYELRPLEGEALQEEVVNLFQEYKKYMTAEGLFFYEEY